MLEQLISRCGFWSQKNLRALRAITLSLPPFSKILATPLNKCALFKQTISVLTTLDDAVPLSLKVSTYSFMATTVNAVWATLVLSLYKNEIIQTNTHTSLSGNQLTSSS